jgi:uncharacterized membrane protein YfcA
VGALNRSGYAGGMFAAPWAAVGLFALGVAVGTAGTLIGAGGGFLLVPVLLVLHPHEPPENLTSLSLSVVFFNALSGTAAYARMKRVDYRSGIMFAAAAIPGAIAGAMVTSFLPRRTFDTIFGIVLTLAGGALLLARPRPDASAAPLPHPGRSHRVIVESDGTRHEYSFRPEVGIALSVVVGFASSLLGIGGGIIHVPALIYLLGFPAHIATATSHFILVFMALAGTSVHIANGALAHGFQRAAWLCAGAVLGAQLGARLSTRVNGKWIVRFLAVALLFVGVRILVGAR